MRSYPLILFLAGLILPGCRAMAPLPLAGTDTDHASVFENKRMQQQFAELTDRVFRVVTYVTYESHVFEPETRLTFPELNRQGVEISGVRARFIHNDSFSGTSCLLKSGADKALLLTCAHTIALPDTVFTYDDLADAEGHQYLIGMSVKTRQMIQVSGHNGSFRAEVLAVDAERDLALLEIPLKIQKHYDNIPVTVVTDLTWGDRVWLAGYPSGRFMMTSGLLSNPGGSDGLFMTDAPFSEGYSGAPAFIYNKKNQGFTLAGVGRSVAARSSYVLRPEKQIHEAAYNTSLPYEGPVYVTIERETAPGVTFLIGSGTLEHFLESCTPDLRKKGWGDAGGEIR